jgi:hypothetical protein
MGDQVFDDLRVGTAACQVQRRSPIFILRIHEVRLIPEDNLKRLQISGFSQLVDLRAETRPGQNQDAAHDDERSNVMEIYQTAAG